jgi:hypothetical protein
MTNNVRTYSHCVLQRRRFMKFIYTFEVWFKSKQNNGTLHANLKKGKSLNICRNEELF